MNYTYKFEKIDPTNLFVQVRYMSEGRPDQIKNFVAGAMNEEAIKEMVEVYASRIIANWKNIEEAPEEIDLVGQEVSATYTEQGRQEVVEEDLPAYDVFTEKLDQRVEETPTLVTISYEVVPLTPEEQELVISQANIAFRRDRDNRLLMTDHVMFSDTSPPTQEMIDYRQALRDVTSQEGFPVNVEWPEAPSSEGIPATITPRQARLALSSQGLLAQVQTAIDSLPESDKEVVTIEWEYAVSIERTSTWISSLGEALGLTVQELDDLFILAATL